MLHGVGRNENDMFSLADQLPDDFLIISPRASFTIANGKYAWYVVDFSTGKPIFNAEQETVSREVITKFVEEVKRIFDINEIYLGGFSQGAIMSYSIGLTNPKLVKGVVALSGRILAEMRPSIIMNADLQNLKIFVGHGILDKTLPIHFAKEAFAYLENSGVQLSYHEYNMGHQITGAVIQDLNAWLAK